MKELSEIISAIASEDDPDIKNRLRVILFKKKQIPTKTIQKETGYTGRLHFHVPGTGFGEGEGFTEP